jgi:hypothetical protein
MTQTKKGLSALQVHRMIDPVRGKKGSYRTAWFRSGMLVFSKTVPVRTEKR